MSKQGFLSLIRHVSGPVGLRTNTHPPTAITDIGIGQQPYRPMLRDDQSGIDVSQYQTLCNIVFGGKGIDLHKGHQRAHNPLAGSTGSVALDV